MSDSPSTFLRFTNGSRWEYRRRTAGGMLELVRVDERGIYAGLSATFPLEDLAARMPGQDCSSSPLAALPPAIRATFTPAERLELANYCGPDDARTCPMDTRREHAPIAERVRVVARPELGFIELRGWLVGSRPDVSGRVGALSLVKLPGQSQPLVVGTHETRLGWAQ